MPETGVFSLDPSHIGLADNLVSIRDVLGIHLVAIGDIEKALPQADHDPNRCKGGSTVVTDGPRQNPRFKVVYGCPDPNFVFF